jgi:hypothetical protein
MAKRLSKALRGKRRWLGVAFSTDVLERQQAKKAVSNAFGDFIEDKPIRLMDFHALGSVQAVSTAHHLAEEDQEAIYLSYGVLEVPHEIYARVRDAAQADGVLSELSVVSITSSGKIRLVRERLGLERPPRKH